MIFESKKESLMNTPTPNNNNRLKASPSSTQASSDVKAISKKIVKDKDISKIQKMVSLITKYEANELSLRDTVLQIADLAGGENGLSFNKDDKESYWIRNRYGRIKRNKSNNANEEGIYFEIFYNLKAILDEKNFSLEQCSGVLRSGLLALKESLSSILKQEEALLTQKNAKLPTSFQAIFSAIEELVEKHYQLIIFERIGKEAKEFGEEISESAFNTREDRYCFARLLTVLGQLGHEIHELKKFANFKTKNKRTLEDNSTETMLAKIFSTLDDIRDKLIHDNNKHYHKIVKGAGFELINDSINILIEKLVSIGDIHSNPKEIGELYEAVKKIATMLTGEEKLGNVSANLNPNAAPKQEKSEEEKVIGELNGLISSAYQQGISLLGTSQAKKSKKHLSPEERLTELNTKYQEFFRQISEERKANFPKSLSVEFKEEIKAMHDKNQSTNFTEQNKEKSKKAERKELRKQEQIITILTYIDKELTYLKELETNASLSNYKKNSCTYHSLTLIGQLIRDIQELDPNGKLEEFSSLTFLEASSEAKVARNQGLAHNIFSLDHEQVISRLRDSILPAHDDFNAMRVITESINKQQALSIVTANNLGKAYMRLHLYREAVRCFKKALPPVEKNPREEITNEPEQEQYNIDLFHTKLNLAMAYMQTGEYSEAGKLLVSLIDSFKSYKDIISQDIFDKMVMIIGLMGKTYFEFDNNYEVASQYYRLALEFTKSSEQRYIYEVGLAICKFMMVKEEPSNKTVGTSIDLNQLIKNPEADPYLRFKACYLLFHQSLDVDISQAELALETANKIFAQNISQLKSQLGDVFYLESMKISQLKVTLLWKKKSNSSEEAEKLYEDFLKSISSLKADLAQSPSVEITYLNFSLYYAQLGSFTKNLDHLERANQCLVRGGAILKKRNLEIAKTFLHLFQAYRTIAQSVSPSESIKFLEKLIGFKKEYAINHSEILLQLGREIIDWLDALHMAKVINTSDIKFIEMYREANSCILSSIELSNKDDMQIIDSYYALGRGLFRVGTLAFSANDLSDAVGYYSKCLTLDPLRKDIKDDYDLCSQELKKLTIVKSLINGLINANEGPTTTPQASTTSFLPSSTKKAEEKPFTKAPGNLQYIEAMIIKWFEHKETSKKPFSKDCENAEMTIPLDSNLMNSSSFKDNVKSYCSTILQLKETDLTFDHENKELSISLNKQSLDMVRSIYHQRKQIDKQGDIIKK